ncbi:MAG: hypothetical protein JNM81_07855 [Rhodospirillaceae bacterium]|nr:hypothetical protein [Rhodospirillaceae bacterium]
MYASGLPGAGRAAPVHEAADETERSGVGVAQTAVWGSFLHRMIRKA